MANLHALSVLIVDGPSLSAFHLRARLVNQGCQVHVVGSFSSAMVFAHRKRVDTVFLEYSENIATQAFCNAMAQMSIPHIFTATGLGESSTVPGPAGNSAKFLECVETQAV